MTVMYRSIQRSLSIVRGSSRRSSNRVRGLGNYAAGADNRYEWIKHHRSIQWRLLASSSSHSNQILKKSSQEDNSEELQNKTFTQASTTKTLRRIAELAQPEAGLIGLSAATLIVTSSVTLLLPTVSGQVIDAALQASPDGDFQPTLVAFGLFGLVSMAGGGVFLRSLWLQQAGNRIVARTKRALMKSILSQEAAYFDVTPKGDILARLTTDAQLIQGAVTIHAVAVLRGIVMSVGSCIMLFSTSTTLAVVSLGTLPPLFVAARLVGRKLREKQREVQRLHAEATSVAEETLGGIRTVTQFVAERRELEAYSGRVTKAHNTAIETGRVQAMFDGAVHVGVNGAVLCVLGYGGTMVIDGLITAGDLTGFLMYSLLLAGNVSGLSGTYAETQKAIAAADRVFQVMDRTPAIPSVLAEDETEMTSESDIGDTFSSKPLSVEFCNVSFSYPTREQSKILGPGFNLDIFPGEVLALVGGSGSGKSTVAALLTRLYDIDKTSVDGNNLSAIRIDGRDIRDISPRELRSSIGIVSQEPLLFDGTIEDNIRYGRRSATDEQVLEAARLAHVLEFTSSFSEGLQTRVGARGAQLSGGQKQRIAVSRLLIKDPPIVVLDEATSALDAESEHHVKKAIDTVMQGRTVISIAHRFSTIRGADRIAVLHNGIITEVGTYEELVQKQDGAFRALMGRQLVGMVGNESV